MAETVYIYSATAEDLEKGEPGAIGRKRADELGVRGIGVTCLAELKAELTKLRAASVQIDRLITETHGGPGVLAFGNDQLNVTTLGGFRGQGFEDLFTAGARVFLMGCSIAGEQSGRNFLMEFAKVFLFKGGGRVGASTSTGYSLGVSWASKEYHFRGDNVYAYITPGGTRVRIAVGSELSSPDGDWKVSADWAEYLYCFSDSPNWVWWDDYNSFLSRSGGKGVGTWDLYGDWLRINWNSGTYETWDAPLFSKEQWGISRTTDGQVHNIVAGQTHELEY
jgi:hypothetical protein